MKKRRFAKYHFVTIVALVSVLAVFMLGAPVISAEKEVRLAVTDIEGLEMLQREFGLFKDLLIKYSGYQVKFFPVPTVLPPLRL